jgi:hypothetical protein
MKLMHTKSSTRFKIDDIGKNTTKPFLLEFIVPYKT